VADGITLVDVTLRDGGYVNGHSWLRADAATVMSSCTEAHISYCEVGYYRPARHEADGALLPAACCPPDYLDALHRDNPDVTMVVMVHGRDVALTDYRKIADLGVGMVRMPAQLSVLPSLPAHVEAARAAGLRVTLNLIRVSEVLVEDVLGAAKLAESCGAEAFYLADSNGSMFPDDVGVLVRAAAETVGIPLGFHAHDGLSLAFINSLTALRAGCTYLDASLAGMGKGGGNLSLELIAGYLRAKTSAPFAMAPLAHAAAAVLTPWKQGVTARCEFMAGSLLDLNVDGIAKYTGTNEDAGLVSMVDAL
jgi:4-hydroxy 2-oxovalerate aldolase